MHGLYGKATALPLQHQVIGAPLEISYRRFPRVRVQGCKGLRDLGLGASLVSSN